MRLTVGPWAYLACFSEIWFNILLSAGASASPLKVLCTPEGIRLQCFMKYFTEEMKVSWYHKWVWELLSMTAAAHGSMWYSWQTTGHDLFSVIVPRSGWVGHGAVSLGKGERKGVSEGVHSGYKWHLCSEHILLVVRRATRGAVFRVQGPTIGGVFLSCSCSQIEILRLLLILNAWPIALAYY